MTNTEDSVLAHVLRHAEKDPQQTAWLQFSADGSIRSVSRSDVVQRAAGVAVALTEAGVRAGEIVAIVMPHTELLAAAWLGALMRGAIPTILAEPSVRMQPA